MVNIWGRFPNERMLLVLQDDSTGSIATSKINAIYKITRSRIITIMMFENQDKIEKEKQIKW